MAKVSELVKLHRDNLRRAGLRPIQIWVPDTRRAGFLEECQRQSLSLARDPAEQDMLEWLAKTADTTGWK